MLTQSDRIRGSVLTHALGDALGAPFEFAPVEAVQSSCAGWIDRLHSFRGTPGPHGPWRSPTPAGTGTDDVRYNRLFADVAARVGGMPDANHLAEALLDVHTHPEAHYPDDVESARQQFDMWAGACCGQLGRTSPDYPGVPADLLATRSVGLNVPTMAGLLVLPSAGLLFAGQPEQAYRATYAAAFFDVAYAREATAAFAAAQALAAAGASATEAIDGALTLDPLRLRGPFGDPFVKAHLPDLLDRAGGRGGRELAEFLEQELCTFGVFDPYRALTIAFCAARAHADDPLAALRVAVNQRDVQRDGTAERMADIDCYASITGAFVGALHGAPALPSEDVSRLLAANGELYAIDLEAVAGDLEAAVSARSTSA